MPKLIDYPRTNYTGAWELAEITDDTGGKCTIETAARKLNRKVSGSFKAIIGSAVKFGLITSKRELLSTTTLFKRIKHAYDKQEELTFHREAFLTPPLFTQICRKFRSRELPVQMLDVMLIREFGVEEINAQGVAKAFVDGCKMVGLLDDRNIIADIDAFPSKQTNRQFLASQTPKVNSFQPENPTQQVTEKTEQPIHDIKRVLNLEPNQFSPQEETTPQHDQKIINTSLDSNGAPDAVANLFGLLSDQMLATNQENHQKIVESQTVKQRETTNSDDRKPITETPIITQPAGNQQSIQNAITVSQPNSYHIQISGPGINTELLISVDEDITLAIALLEKIRRQLKT